MKFIKILLILITVQGLLGQLKAQEVHNSQYYSMPLYLNPANTGSSNYDFRGGVDIRNQWSTVTVPFASQYLYGDVKLPIYFIEKSWMGLGVSFLNDVAGEGIKSTYGAASLSFHKIISRGNDLLLSGGVTTQIINKSVDYQNLNFADEWQDNDFNKGTGSGKLQGASSLFYLDLAIGAKLTYFYNTDQYSLGLSVSHLNQPSESFYKMTNNLSRKFSVYASATKWLGGGSFIVTPSLIVDIQDGRGYGIFGTNVAKPYNIGRTKSILFGLWYRTTEEIIPTVGMEFNSLKLMASYDVAMTDNTYKNRGGFEISLTYTIGYSNPIEQIFKYKYLKPRRRSRSGAIPCPKFIEGSSY